MLRSVYNCRISNVLLLLGSLLVAFLLRFEGMVPVEYWPRFALVAALFAALILVTNHLLAAGVVFAVNFAAGFVPNSVVLVAALLFLLLRYGLIYRHRHQH
jgi:hypothetical protein